MGVLLVHRAGGVSQTSGRGWGDEMKKRSESALKAKDGRALVTQWRNVTAIIIFNTFSFTYVRESDPPAANALR